jgi:hypothetical protein
MKRIICFLTVKPSKEFYQFAKKLKNDVYDVYICIDDNTYEIPDYDNVIPIIKMDASEPESHGFKSCVMWLNDKACSRDKALYYFSKKFTDYRFIWFLEDDVFVPSVQTIPVIDKKYVTPDLLAASHWIKKEYTPDWHWKYIVETNKVQYSFPLAASMICAIRVSRHLMKAIENYATKHKNLFLDEALFNTIALKNNLNAKMIPELSSIVYRRDWKITEIKKSNLYHPVKCAKQQAKYRSVVGE